MSDNKLNGWYWVTHGGETFPSQFTDGLSDIMDVNEDRIPAERLKVGPRIQEALAFDPATVKVGDEVLVRGKVITIDKDDRTLPFYVELGSGDEVWFRPGDISGVITAPELPRRDDGWSADGKSVDPWHGVSAEERDRRCEAARRAVEEAHRPKASECVFVAPKIGLHTGFWVFPPKGKAKYFDLVNRQVTTATSHIDDLVDNPRVTAKEAYDSIDPVAWPEGRPEFTEPTGYVPPQCEGWRFTSAIGGGCFGFHASGRGFCYGLGTAWYDRPNPSTFDDAVGGNERHEITAAEAYEICRANGQGNKFCELTGYQP